jgi:epoxyqueuosine reductase
VPHPSVPEWSGEELVYLSPGRANNYFGYQMRHERSANELDFGVRTEERTALQDGKPAQEQVDLGDRAAAATMVKSLTYDLGADLVGITPLDRKYVYKGHDVPHAFAIVIACAMDPLELFQAPRIETNTEYLRVYDQCSQIAVQLSISLRELGYPARAHTLRQEDVAMIPLAQAAGLGELGKHGSLINKEMGCSFRLSVVTTDVEMTVDGLRDDGIEDFCSKCQMCVTYCPGDAISHEKQEVRGIEKWVVNTEKCTPYFSSHYACAICLRVCPLNAKAFGGRFMDAFKVNIQEIKTDWPQTKARLQMDLQEAWSLVPAK